jgi:nucleoside-triphosphatase THEP1
MKQLRVKFLLLSTRLLRSKSCKQPKYSGENVLTWGRARAFRLVDAACEPYIPDAEVGDIGKFENIIGYIGDKMTWHPEVLEKEGTPMIRRSLSANKQLLLMDELGRIELQAPGFQQSVFEALDSSQPVLGVIKPESNVFLDAIRNRPDVQIFDLTKMTHQNVRQELTGLIYKL